MPTKKQKHANSLCADDLSTIIYWLYILYKRKNSLHLNSGIILWLLVCPTILHTCLLVPTILVSSFDDQIHKLDVSQTLGLLVFIQPQPQQCIFEECLNHNNRITYIYAAYQTCFLQIILYDRMRRELYIMCVTIVGDQCQGAGS